MAVHQSPSWWVHSTCLSYLHTFLLPIQPLQGNRIDNKIQRETNKSDTWFKHWDRTLLSRKRIHLPLAMEVMRITTSTPRKPLPLKQSVFYPRVSMCACNKNNCYLSSLEMSKAKPVLLISRYGFHVLLAVWATAIATSFGDWFCLRLGLKRLSDEFWLFGKRGQRTGLPWKWRQKRLRAYPFCNFFGAVFPDPSKQQLERRRELEADKMGLQKPQKKIILSLQTLLYEQVYLHVHVGKQVTL